LVWGFKGIKSPPPPGPDSNPKTVLIFSTIPGDTYTQVFIVPKKDSLGEIDPAQGILMQEFISHRASLHRNSFPGGNLCTEIPSLQGIYV